MPRFFHLTAFGISARKASHQEVLLTSNATYVSVGRETKEWNKCSFLSLIIVNVCLPKWAPGRNRGITSCHPRRGPRLKRRVLFWQIRMSPVLVKQRCAVTVPHLPTSLRGAVSHFKLEFQIRKIKEVPWDPTLSRGHVFKNRKWKAGLQLQSMYNENLHSEKWARSFGRALKFTRLSPVDSEIITKPFSWLHPRKLQLPSYNHSSPRIAPPHSPKLGIWVLMQCASLPTDKGQLCSHKTRLFYTQTYFIKTLMPTKGHLNIGTHWPLPTLASLSLKRWALEPKEILFF